MDPFQNGPDKKRFRTHIFVFFSTCKRTLFSVPFCDVFYEPVVLHVSCLAYFTCVLEEETGKYSSTLGS